jgi:hypothetical protein
VLTVCAIAATAVQDVATATSNRLERTHWCYYQQQHALQQCDRKCYTITAALHISLLLTEAVLYTDIISDIAELVRHAESLLLSMLCTRTAAEIAARLRCTSIKEPYSTARAQVAIA